MLNRAALLVRPAAPFLEWAKSLDDSGAQPNPAGKQTVYLVPEFGNDPEGRDVLRLAYAGVFARELHGWHTIEADLPKDRSFAVRRVQEVVPRRTPFGRR